MFLHRFLPDMYDYCVSNNIAAKGESHCRLMTGRRRKGQLSFVFCVIGLASVSTIGLGSVSTLIYIAVAMQGLRTLM